MIFTNYTDEQLIEFAKSYIPKGKTDLTPLIYLEANKRGIEFLLESKQVQNSFFLDMKTIYIPKQHQKKNLIKISFYGVVNCLEFKRLKSLKKIKKIKNKSQQMIK